MVDLLAGKQVIDAARPQAQGGPTVAAAELDRKMRMGRLKKVAETAMLGTRATKPGAGDILAHDFSWGLMRPAGGLGGALAGELNELLGRSEPATFGERYTAQEQAYDEMLRQARENSGWLGTGAGLVGSVTSGGPGASASASLPKAIAEGTVSSGIQSAAEAEGDLSERAKAGVKGLITGAAGSAILGGLASRFLNPRVARDLNRGPSPDVLRTQAKNLFSQLDKAGVAYDPGQAGTLLQGLESELLTAGYNPKIQTKAAAVVDEFRNKISGNQPLSLNALQDLRQQARAAGASIEPEDRRIAGILMGHIDDFVGNSAPALSVSGMGMRDISSIWKDARSKWRALNNTEDLLWNVSKAERRAASTASGANTENVLRQNIRSVLDRAEQPRRMSPYNEAEIAAMEKVVRGTPTQNFLRATGNRLGGSGPLGMAGSGGVGLGLGAGAIALGFDPQTAAQIGTATAPLLWGAGKAARMTSSRMAEENVDDLIRIVANEGIQSPRIQAIMQGPPTRTRLALVQALGRGTAGGGREAAQNVPY
jgi:hypothetical protein